MPNEILHAKIMTDEELSSYFEQLYNRFYESKKNVLNNILKYKENLIDGYFKYEEEQINVFKEKRKELLRSIELWNKKECNCGQKLKVINSTNGDFWGCTNFNNKSFKHKTFSLTFVPYYKDNLDKLKVRIDSHWASKIITSCNLKNQVKAKDLIEFYINSGFDDLRVKYNYEKTSIESISGFVNGKRNSSKEEKEIQKYFSQKYDKCLSQIGIKYKLINCDEKIVILDLILSDKNNIYLLEIKRYPLEIKEEQLNLYFNLLKHILSDKKDKRSLKAVFLISNKYEYDYDYEYFKQSEEKFIYFESIQNCKNKIEIETKLNSKIFKQ